MISRLKRSGTTQRDGMGREEGGGFRMGNTCMPVADSFRYLAEPIQYLKFKNKIKNKRNSIFKMLKEIKVNLEFHVQLKFPSNF